MKVVNDTIDLNLTKENYDRVLKSGLFYTKDLDLAGAGYFIRVAVRDAASGNVGPVNVRTDRLRPA